MPTFALARVIEVLEDSAGARRVSVTIEGSGEPKVAVAYWSLVGECAPGDEVLLNTTAVELGLGTGGEHFVVANLSRHVVAELSGGHIMKLRYTPHQLDVLAAEEQGSPLVDALADARSLEGRAVVVLSLHSQLAAACAVARREAPDACIAFVMSDATALPVAVSRLVGRLEELGLLDLAVTAGQAFGGDIEAVNRYSGLLAAAAAGAGLIIAGAGPGGVGTGTAMGHSGVDLGEWVNAVVALEGRPVVAPRISTADPRERHRGLSHHTLTALGRVALGEALVALPEMAEPLAGTVEAAVEAEPSLARHTWRRCGAARALEAMADRGLEVTTMGRAARSEEALFEAAGAAVMLAMEVGGPF